MKLAYAVRVRLLPAVLVIVGMAVISFVSCAQARLVYERGFRTSHPSIWIARDDGRHPARLASGLSPVISPNGRFVAYDSSPVTAGVRLMLIPATGGRPRVLLSASLLFAVSWSPDSRRLAVAEQTPATRTRLGVPRLVTVDVATGRVHAIARPSLPYSMSFSPDSRQLAYTWSASQDPVRDDIYRQPAAGGSAVALTFGGHSMLPVWGRHWIVFARETPASRRNPLPKHNLYLVRPNRARLHRLTRVAIARDMFGFTPIAWSADGCRLIAELSGPGTSYVVTVDPRTGAVRRVGKPSGGTAGGIIRGAGLSRDGTTILGVAHSARGAENVVALPYVGGRARVLARDAVGPSWSR